MTKYTNHEDAQRYSIIITHFLKEVEVHEANEMKGAKTPLSPIRDKIVSGLG